MFILAKESCEEIMKLEIFVSQYEKVNDESVEILCWARIQRKMPWETLAISNLTSAPSTWANLTRKEIT